jgi:S1-C subfamily serine protease
MTALKSLLSRPFVAGLAGGLVVGIFGWLAIAAGWIEADAGGAASTVASTATTDAAPAQTQPAAGEALSAGDIYNRDGDAVAYIEAEQKQAPSASPFDPLPQQGGTATGSGFLIDDQGHILTNAHVVGGSSEVTVRMGDDGATLDAKLLGSDPSTDIAVLEVDPAQIDAEPLRFGDSSEVEVGDAVIAIGNPFGLDRTVTAGIVSALQRQISAPDGFTISDVIQTDAAINPGNSGGPLIDANGEVIGINSQIATGGAGRGNVGVGFAVPIDTVETVARQILDDGTAEHAFIGITGGDLTSEIADTLNLDVEDGALIQAVESGSPADEAGLQGGESMVTIDGRRIAADGDVITSAGGEDIDGMDDLIAVINGKRPGDEIELQVHRDGETSTIAVELGERPEDAGRQ